MDKKEIYNKLNENMLKLETLENEISMIELAIYQKNIEKLEKQKLNEVQEFFEQQSKVYNQKSEKYQSEINKNIEKYKIQIDKLIDAYDNLYLSTFRIMQNAMNNQKISMANIVTLTEKLNNKKLTDEEFKKIQNSIIACAQKKLNYGVIIEECKARIKWCIQNVQKDINEVFINNIYQLETYKENIINKLRRIIFNIVSGKSKYKRFLENYETEYMKDIKNKNSLKIIDVVTILNGVTKQMEEVKKQISIKYEQMIYSS